MPLPPAKHRDDPSAHPNHHRQASPPPEPQPQPHPYAYRASQSFSPDKRHPAVSFSEYPQQFQERNSSYSLEPPQGQSYGQGLNQPHSGSALSVGSAHSYTHGHGQTSHQFPYQLPHTQGLSGKDLGPNPNIPAQVQLHAGGSSGSSRDMKGRLLVPKSRRKTKSQVWNYFKRVDALPNKAQCTICSFFCDNTRGSTSALHKHLASHGIELNEKANSGHSVTSSESNHAGNAPYGQGYFMPPSGNMLQYPLQHQPQMQQPPNQQYYQQNVQYHKQHGNVQTMQVAKKKRKKTHQAADTASSSERMNPLSMKVIVVNDTAGLLQQKTDALRSLIMSLFALKPSKLRKALALHLSDEIVGSKLNRVEDFCFEISSFLTKIDVEADYGEHREVHGITHRLEKCMECVKKVGSLQRQRALVKYQKPPENPSNLQGVVVENIGMSSSHDTNENAWVDLEINTYCTVKMELEELLRLLTRLLASEASTNILMKDLAHPQHQNVDNEPMAPGPTVQKQTASTPTHQTTAVQSQTNNVPPQPAPSSTLAVVVSAGNNSSPVATQQSPHVAKSEHDQSGSVKPIINRDQGHPAS